MNPRPNFHDLRGMTEVARTFAAAVQRGDRILLIAGPGDGATALAQRAVGLLPDMTEDERADVTDVQTAARMLPEGDQADRRPFRAPHHTVSWGGMFGSTRTHRDDDGDLVARTFPGELELATHGVLLLGEVTEFRRSVVEGIGHHIDSSTTLITVAPPCPCGMANHPRAKSRCTCTEAQLGRWVERLGRIVADLSIGCVMEVPHMTNDERAYGERCPSTQDLLSAGSAAPCHVCSGTDTAEHQMCVQRQPTNQPRK